MVSLVGATQSEVLKGSLDALVTGSANQTDHLGHKLDQLIAAMANLQALLNDKLEEVIAGSANQTDLLNRKLEQLIAGRAERIDQLGRVFDRIFTNGAGRSLSGAGQAAADAPGTITRDPADGPTVGRLKLLCVGTGRNGSSSLGEIIRTMFERADTGYSVGHEYQVREICDNFCKFKETADKKFLDAVHAIIAAIPHECVIGNYAAVLPVFAEIYGRDLKLVELRRADRSRCIESLKENSKLFPASYRYYGAAAGARYKRMAAFHFGEMTRKAWNRLSLDEMFAWYYDTTRALIDKYRDLFAAHLSITTESMNDESTRQALAKMILNDASILPPPIVSNPHYLKEGELPPQKAEFAQWMLQTLNAVELGANDTYLLEYAVSRLHQWLNAMVESESKQLDKADPSRRRELSQSVHRAKRALTCGLDQFEGLQNRLK